MGTSSRPGSEGVPRGQGWDSVSPHEVLTGPFSPRAGTLLPTVQFLQKGLQRHRDDLAKLYVPRGCPRVLSLGSVPCANCPCVRAAVTGTATTCSTLWRFPSSGA